MARLLPALALVFTALAASPAVAGDDADKTGRVEKGARAEEFCKENPKTCERRRKEREDREAWCKKNPKDCKAMEQERSERRAERRKKMEEACKADPEKCKKHREEARKHRRERNEAFCKEHPEHCDGKEAPPRQPGPPR